MGTERASKHKRIILWRREGGQVPEQVRHDAAGHSSDRAWKPKRLRGAPPSSSAWAPHSGASTLAIRARGASRIAVFASTLFVSVASTVASSVVLVTLQIAGVSVERSGRPGGALPTAQHDGGHETRAIFPVRRDHRNTAQLHGGTRAPTGLTLHRQTTQHTDAGREVGSDGPCAQIGQTSFPTAARASTG
jgi:hypothetical protein